MREDKLNTLESYLKGGFKIERDGKIITLTDNERNRLTYLDKARWGRYTIENLIEYNKDYEFAKEFLNDAYICYRVETEYAEEAAYLDEELMSKVAKEILDEYRDEE